MALQHTISGKRNESTTRATLLPGRCVRLVVPRLQERQLGIGGCIHWGGSIAAGGGRLKIAFLAFYVAATAMGDAAFLVLALRYPRPVARFRRVAAGVSFPLDDGPPLDRRPPHISWVNRMFISAKPRSRTGTSAA